MSLLARVTGRVTSHRRGVLVILSGTGVGQLLALLVAPILSRLYNPTDFGIFAICSALILTLGTVATSRFDLAIPLPESERDAHGLALLGGLSAALVGVIGTGVVLLTGQELARLLDQNQLMPWLLLVPVSATAMGWYLALNQLAIRHGRFGSIGRRNVLQQVTMVAVQVGSGFAGLRPGGLVIGFGLAQAASAISLLAGSGLRGTDAKASRRPAVLRSLAKRYRRFPLLLGPSGLLNVLGLQLPVLLLAYSYGSDVAGWIGLTQRVLALPVTLVGTAIGQVYLSQFARAIRFDHDVAMRIFKRASMTLAGFALVPLILLLFLGPLAFSLVFGAEWLTSGKYAQAMSLSLAGQIVAAPLSQTLIALERQRRQFAWDATRVIAIAAAVLIAKAAGATALTAVWVIAVVLLATYAFSWILSATSLRTAQLERGIGDCTSN